MKPHAAQRMRTKAAGGLISELSLESTKRIPLHRILVHWALCFIVVVFGLRVSQEANLIRVNLSRVEDAADLLSTTTATNQTTRHYESFTRISGPVKSARVYVGRHPILVRPWPHPEPLEMAQAYRMLARVQLEQQRLYGIRSWRPVIAITPMFVRTFQSVHLTGLVHTLSLVRGPVTWIVVEAGGASAETAALLKQARVHKLVHLAAASEERVPQSLQERRILESHLRIEGLRYVREQNLEGVVVFADDSNIHTLQFFDAVQKVQWLGALPLGILPHAGIQDPLPDSSPLPVQVPACDPSSGRITGWHALSSDGESGDGEVEELEWAGFAMDARAVWAAEPARPKWIREWAEWARPEDGRFVDVRNMVSDETQVEALGRCESGGGAVLVWWARMEARSDSKFPSRWALDSPPEIIVPAERTPWPDRTFPLSSPPPPAPRTAKHKGGNRSGGREGRTRRRKRIAKSRPLENQRESTKGT